MPLSLCRNAFDRFDDARMAAAAAKVVFHAVDDLLPGKSRVPEQHRVGVHDHARCAEAALDGAGFGKSGLQWMEFFSLRQAFDGGHFLAAHFADGQQAGTNRIFSYDNGAGAAQASAAAVFRPGKPQVRAQHPQERSVAFHIEGCGFSVSLKLMVSFISMLSLWV